MNNGKIKVTNVAAAYDISASSIITLENTGDHAISVGFGDLDSTFAFGEGIILDPKETMEITSTDARRGDGTFYAVSKDTAATKVSELAYAADGGVSPVMTLTADVSDGDTDVAIDAAIAITASNTIDDAEDASYLVDVTGDALVAITPAVVGKVLTITPDADLTNDNEYALFSHVVDSNGRFKTIKIGFTTIAA